MTASVVDRERQAVAPPRPRSGPRWTPIKPAQIIACQVALAGALAASGRGPDALAWSATAGIAVVAIALARVRRRWLYEWFLIAVRYALRRHRLPAEASASTLLRFATPDVAQTAEGFTDDDGITSVLEVLPARAVARQAPRLPSVAELVDGADVDVRLGLLVAAVSAPAPLLADAPAAASYRQLTDGQVPALLRTFLTVRVRRPPGWSDHELVPTLSGVNRRLAKRLGPHRLFEGADAMEILAELAHHNGGPAREHWSFVAAGGLCQATYRVDGVTGGDRLVRRLLMLDASAITIATGPSARTFTLRVAALSPAHLGRADAALRRLLAREAATADRLDGDHRTGLAATLPLGRLTEREPWRLARGDHLVRAAASTTQDAGRSIRPTVAPTQSRDQASDPTVVGTPRRAAIRPTTATAQGRGQPTRPTAATARGAGSDTSADDSPQVQPETAPESGSIVDVLELPAGVVLGFDPQRHPVAARLFGPRRIRAVLVGDAAVAKVLVLRAMAVGARVEIETARASTWQRFVQSAAAPEADLWLTRAGSRGPGWPATPLRPFLHVVDRGAPRGGDAPEQLRREFLPGNQSVASRVPAGGPSPVRNARGGRLGPPAPHRRSSARTPDAPRDRTERSPSEAWTDPDRPWQATVIVLDKLDATNAGVLEEADLILLQRLLPDEATTAGEAPGLAETAGWLTRLPDDMLAVVRDGTVHWAQIAQTPIESVLIGPLERPPTAVSRGRGVGPPARGSDVPFPRSAGPTRGDRSGHEPHG